MSKSDYVNPVPLLSMENVDRLRPASIITRITNDVEQVPGFINEIMRIMVKAPITCIGVIILILVQTLRQVPVMAGILAAASVLIPGICASDIPSLEPCRKGFGICPC